MHLGSTIDVMQAAVANKLSAELSSKGSVTVPDVTPEEIHELHTYMKSPEVVALVAKLQQQHKETPLLRLHPTAQQMLVSSGQNWTDDQRLALGIGTGVATGGGLSLMFTSLRGGAPTYVFGLGAMLVCGALAGAVAGKVIPELHIGPEGISLRG